jgi:hypothetical protein
MWPAILNAFSSAAIAAMSATALDPFSFFRPSIAVSADDRRELDRGQSIAHIVRGADREVAVFAAIQVSIDGDRLVAWMRDIGELKKSPHVLAIGRFSDPPTIEDLDRLTLDEGDLSAIRRCQRGDCGLKLAGAEIARLRQALAEAGDNWKPVLQDTFRQIVLQRVEGYLANGHAALLGYEDKGGPLSLEARFSSLLNRSFFLTGSTPRFAEYLDQYPRAPISEVESFIYWSKERLEGKAIISATHVSILRSAERALPDALVAGKGIFATHYVNASLGLTAILRGSPGSPNYLAYVNRSDVDMAGGVFGGLVRVLMERRLKKEAATVLVGLRQRLESGDPASPAARFNPGSGTAGFPAASPRSGRLAEIRDRAGAPLAHGIVAEPLVDVPFVQTGRTDHEEPVTTDDDSRPGGGIRPRGSRADTRDRPADAGEAGALTEDSRGDPDQRLRVARPGEQRPCPGDEVARVVGAVQPGIRPPKRGLSARDR